MNRDTLQMNAELKNIKISTPLNDEELRLVGNRILEGSLVILKRPPWSCVSCGNVIRNLRYIGDIDAVAEWETICEKCGNKFYS